MKLLSVKLCNFRQFYGKTPEIHLASGQRNTTIIHGNNGAGKTTLLNAFTWVLYEKFTAAFDSPNLLINKRAIAEAECGSSVECWVEIQFEHENKRYQIKRKCYACQDKNGTVQYSKSQVFMLVAGDDGRWYPPLEQPDDIINRILPESLHQYFFFDGEHIDHIFRHNEKNNIAEDTKELLGVKVLDRGIEHLKKAQKTLQEELKLIGDIEIKKLLKEKLNLESRQEKLNDRQKEILERSASQEELKKVLSQQVVAILGAEELKKTREKLEIQERKRRQNLLESRSKIKQLISSQGQAIFLPEIKSSFQDLIINLRQKGELPSGIKKQFVQQLLDRGGCICGRGLTPGTDAYQQVRDWMDRAGIAEVEEAAIMLESKVSELDRQVAEFWQAIDREQANISQWRRELSQIEKELDTIREKFRHYPNEEIQSLQNQLDEIDGCLKDLTLERGENQKQIEIFAREIEEISKQITRQKLKEERQVTAQRRLQATQDAIARLIEVRSRLEKQFRLSLERRVQEIFSSISFTPYLPRISQTYELTLLENTSGVALPVAASTGENQILSLSFIGGIIDRVREWSQKAALMGPDSSTFPIVMDSPFGSLDEIYRRQVAKFIPQLANQLVVLVTKTQWRGEVEGEIAESIGKEYVLSYHSPKPDCEEDFIEIGGRPYPSVRRSPNEFEYTEILEVNPLLAASEPPL